MSDGGAPSRMGLHPKSLLAPFPSRDGWRGFGQPLGFSHFCVKKQEKKPQVFKEGKISFTPFPVSHFSKAYFLSNAAVQNMNPSGENS